MSSRWYPKTLAIIITSLALISIFVKPAKNTYYVAKNGNNANPGTLSLPWLTIQNCLNKVLPKDTCLIRAGTYNESLTIITSGSSGAIITLQNYNGETVTVNSGTSMSLKTTGHQSFYTIDGLRFISSISGGEQVRTIDFANGWSTNETVPAGGNGFITLRNCYVEGAVLFNGPNNTVENCEFNGKNLLNDGVHFRFAASLYGIIRNNVIHDYLGRAVWADSSTDGILIENNRIYNTYLGIDCDGAYVPVTHCNVIGNTIYNTGRDANHQGWGASIFLENAFNAVVDKNIIYNSPTGTGIYVVNYGNGPDWFTKDNVEYRDRDLDATITNNIIYNLNGSAPILDYAASGIGFYNNTIVMIDAPSWLHAVEMYEKYVTADTTYYPQRWTIRNNIITGTGDTMAWWASNSISFSTSTFSNNLYYGRVPETGEIAINFDPMFVGPADFHLRPDSPAIDAGFNLGSVNPYDFDGNIRPQLAGYDIGAFEFPEK